MLFDSALHAIMLLLVAAPLISLISTMAKKERATRSLNAFTVRTPRTYRLVFLAGAVAFQAIGIAIAAWSYLFEGSVATDVLWVCIWMGLFVFLIYVAATLQRLRVTKEGIAYRTPLGRTRSCTFAELEALEHASEGAFIALRARGRRFALISGDCACVKNLLERCEREGVPVRAREQRPTTLGLLLRTALSIPLGIGVGVSAFLAFTLAGSALVGAVPFEMIAMPLTLAPLIVAICVGGCSVLCIRGILLIKEQERHFGCAFADEMRERGARGNAWHDDRWFVGASACRILAVRRDFLKRVGRAKASDDGHFCPATLHDGRKVRLYADKAALDRLRDWFNRG